MREVLPSIGARHPTQEFKLAHGGDDANIQQPVVKARVRRHLYPSSVGDIVPDCGENDVARKIPPVRLDFKRMRAIKLEATQDGPRVRGSAAHPADMLVCEARDHGIKAHSGDATVDGGPDARQIDGSRRAVDQRFGGGE